MRQRRRWRWWCLFFFFRQTCLIIHGNVFWLIVNALLIKYILAKDDPLSELVQKLAVLIYIRNSRKYLKLLLYVNSSIWIYGMLSCGERFHFLEQSLRYLRRKFTVALNWTIPHSKIDIYIYLNGEDQKSTDISSLIHGIDDISGSSTLNEK